MTTTPASTIPAIERRVELAAPRERVWHALTDPTELATWFCQGADVRAEVGAAGWLAWDAHGRFAIRVEAVEAPAYLAWRGARDPDTPIDEGPSTLVEYWLDDASDGGTLLRVRESGFERLEDRATNVQGWLHQVGALAGHVATEPWHRGIVRTYALRSAPDRVWRAFSHPEELAHWWAGSGAIEIRPGYEGWWEWPDSGGRFAMRIEAVEPPTYLAWLWVTDPETAIAAADQVLRTEWVLSPRADGGTDLHLLETGFRQPTEHRANDEGWDGDVIPGLRRHLGEVA